MGRKLFALAVLVFFAAVLSGCATIITGTTSEITITSEPDGAYISIGGMSYGMTPLVATVPNQRQPLMVKAELKGYESDSRILAYVDNWWVLGNLLFGGLIGVIIDIVSGACYPLEPTRFHFQLRAK